MEERYSDRVTPKTVSFIEKDSRRFSDTNGRGYAQFLTQRLTRSNPTVGRKLIRQEVLFPAPQGGRGKREHVHELTLELNGSEGGHQGQLNRMSRPAS